MEKYLMKRTTPITPKPKVSAIGHPSSPSEEEISKAIRERAQAHVNDLYSRAKKTTTPTKE
jgi:hypothetical protein